MKAGAENLHELVAQPYLLLQEMERRSLADLADSERPPTAPQWVGVGFRLAGANYVADRSEIKEILLPSPVTPVPGARNWLLGIASLRGQMLPVFDPAAFLFGQRSGGARTTRVLVLNLTRPLGLAVDEVFGFRRFDPAEATQCHGESPTAPYVEREFRRDDEAWPVFSLCRLVDSDGFQDVAR